MADQFNWDIVVRLATQGLKSAKGDIDGFTDAVDQMSKEGKISEGVWKSASQAAVQAGKRASEAAGDFSDVADELPRLRYALYDVSSALAITGTALVGVSVAAAATAISMDRAFADVLRTTETFGAAGGAAEGLRKEFEALFTSLPTSFADLTEIGTLAGQLNIARGSVAEFTELVAMFAATTDVSVEQAATAFGRLSQLLKVPASELQNLGSSILAVGVNSVATESQIIAISTQITSIASTAGFSADQVFGLSAALASLGTQPELSRGVITRLFSNITIAINQGGERLEAFGRVAGLTGAEFAKAWGDDASGALQRFVEGLGRVEGSRAVETLNNLGITASRDVPTILRLAQNSEVLAESLQVAAEGYANGTALQEQYSVISSTVAEKLNVLVNNFQNLIATIGASAGALGGLVDIAIALTKAFTALVDNPVAATILGIVGTLTVLAGVASLAGAAFLRIVAGAVAGATAINSFSAAGVTSIATLQGMISAQYGVVASTSAATVAVRALTIAIRSIPVIGAVLVAASAGFAIFEAATKSARDRAEEFFGDLAGFNDALAADTQVWRETGDAIATFTVETEKSAPAVDTSRQAVESWLDIQKEVPGEVANANSEIDAQTFALGQNADAWIRAALAENNFVTGLANTENLRGALEQAGFSIDSAIQAGLSGGTAVDTYLNSIETRIRELAAIGVISDIEANSSVASARKILSEIENLRGGIEETANVSSFLGTTSGDAAAGLSELADAANEAYTGLIDSQNAALSFEDSIFSLGQSLAENGAEFDVFSEAGRANLGSLLDVMDAIASNNSPEVAASKLQGLFNFIVQGGYASASQLAVLQNAIATLSGGSKVLASQFNPASFFGGWSSGAEKAARSTSRAGGATRAAAAEVRTLVDYANDLSGVFNRAFDIRFSAGSTLDAITSSFISIREASEESARSVARLKAEIQGLQSDLAIQEYFLGIALEYGDLKRAEAIQANIAKLQADLADKTSSLSEEQSKNSKELTGNSKAAINNRKQMEDLVKQYQEHITALASSGLSQQELATRTAALKQQFIEQAVQLGYSREEVLRYAASFDDLAKIIATIPRNITVSANTDPALQALNEFIAKARSQIGSGLSVPVSTSFDGSGDARFGRATDLRMQIERLQAEMNSYNVGTPQRASFASEIRRISQLLASGNYYTGGFTGQGGKYEPAGIVHRGEYVIPKQHVNQSTGLPYADALGKLTRGASGPGYANGGYVRQNTGGITPAHFALSPMGMQQFAQLFSEYMRVQIGDAVIGNSASNQFQNQTASGAF